MAAHTGRAQMGGMLRVGVAALVVVAAAAGPAAAAPLELWAARVTETWVEKETDAQPFPRWEDADGILGAPDGHSARLVVTNGWNDYGSITVDLGVEVAAGELVVVHRQQGPGFDKSTDVKVAGLDGHFRAAARLGCPAETATSRIRLDLPTRYVTIYAGAGGQVGADSVWYLDAVGVRCDARDVCVAGAVPERLAALRESLSGPAVTRGPGRGGAADVIARAEALSRRVAGLQARYEADPRAEVGAEVAAAYPAIHDEAQALLFDGLVALNTSAAFQGGGPAAEAPPYLITWDSSLRKVRPGEPYPVAPGRLDVTLHAARGEYEAAQMVVLPTGGLLRDVTVQASAPVRPGGALPRPEVLRVGYVTCHGQVWPDPLFPDATASEVSGRPQSFLVRIHVPYGARPGQYEGKVSVSAAGLPTARATLRVRVYPFDVPLHPRLKCPFGCGTPPEYHDEMLRHHLNPGGLCCASPADADYALGPDGGLRLDFTRYDRAMARYIALGLNTFGLPYTCGDAGGIIPARMTKTATDPATGAQVPVSLNPLDGPEARQRLARFLGDFRDHLRRRGWLPYAFLYLWDEPSPRYFPAIAQIAEVVKEAAPEIPAMVTAAPATDLMAAADIFCPIVQWAAPFDRADAAALLDLRRAGKDLWWYTCGDPYPLPTFAIPHQLAATRLMFWLNFKLGFTGNLYWAAAYWPDAMKADPYTDPGGGGVGDGMLFYPPERPGQIIGSLRLEAIRDGVEDYEAFALLSSVSVGRSPVLALPPTVARDPASYTEDPEAIEAHRARLHAELARYMAAGGR